MSAPSRTGRPGRPGPGRGRRSAAAFWTLAALAGLAALWCGAALVWSLGSYRLSALVLALAALPATFAVLVAFAARGRLSWGASCLLVWVLCLSAWASASGLVAQVWPWDSIEHFLLALVWCVWVGRVLAWLDPAARRSTVLLAAFGAAAACGVLWEVVEWAADQTLGTDMSLSDADTVTDLVVDLCGALVGAGWLSRTLRRVQVPETGT